MNKRREKLLEACLVMGFFLIVVGIGAIYWPAALIAAGIMLIWLSYPRKGGD